jgi:hypothetical protein
MMVGVAVSVAAGIGVDVGGIAVEVAVAVGTDVAVAGIVAGVLGRIVTPAQPAMTATARTNNIAHMR